MALSKEEISIRLGVDGKSVNAGLQNITARLKVFAAAQKNIWDQGVQHHAASEKKKEEAEVAAAVNAAERSNRARMLWRERSAKRELKLAEESAKKIAEQEAATANTFYNRSIGAASKKIAGIGKSLAAGAAMGGVMMLIGAITDAFDAASDAISKKFYDLIYGVSENLEKMVEKNSSKWKAAREAQKKTWEDKSTMAKAIRDEKFDSSSNLGKLFIVETELAAQEKIAKLAYEIWQTQLKKNKNSEASFLAESKFYEEEKKRIDYAKEVREQTRSLSKEEMIERLQFEWRLAQSQKDRRAMAAIRSEIGTLTGQSLNPPSSQKLFGLAAVDDYIAKIKAGQDAYKSKTDYSQFGKAIAEAQKEVAEEFVQKVSIVEIKEK